MSGVKPLALSSDVARVLETYDAGIRVIRQIKARRETYGVVQPTGCLEESLQRGKNDIEEIVKVRLSRFGKDFEILDSRQIRLALVFRALLTI